jgi:hypothetical protein
MIANISHRLIQLGGDLSECEPLNKVQAQSMALVFSQGIEKCLYGRISDHLAEWFDISAFPRTLGN